MSRGRQMRPGRSASVAVVGDFMLDSYVRGAVTRVCPDAPAPVLDAEPERCSPGGAGNVAVGCAARGLEAIACGFIGRDTAARTLETLLAEAGVRLDALVSMQERETLVKRRFCAGEQVLLRVDSGTTAEIAADDYEGRLGPVFGGVDAVLVSDYGYGSVTPAVLCALQRVRVPHAAAQGRAPLLLVDAKDAGRYRDLAPDVVKPNYAQALALLGDSPAEDRVAHAAELLPALQRATGASAVIVTLDAQGCVIGTRRGDTAHITAPAVDVRSTTGAGDTFLVALAEGLLGGNGVVEAARYATRAASRACSSNGTATAGVHIDQPVAERGKRVGPEELREWSSRVREQGRRIVLTNGCFDIFHAGHAEFLARAAEQADALLVAVNTDDSVRRLKGDGRPVNGLEDRLRVLEAIGVVAAVTWFDGDTAAEVAAAVSPEVYVKGSDYRGMKFPESELVTARGGRVHFVDLLDGRSTSEIVRRTRAREELAV